MKEAAKRVCGCGCGREFRPKYESQRYVNHKHQNRAAQSRFRERVKVILQEAANG